MEPKDCANFKCVFPCCTGNIKDHTCNDCQNWKPKEESWKDTWVYASLIPSVLSNVGKVIEDKNGFLTLRLLNGDIRLNRDKTEWHRFTMPKELLDC